MKIAKAIEFMYQQVDKEKIKACELGKNAQHDEAITHLTQAEYWMQLADWLTELEDYKETETKTKNKLNKLGECLQNYLGGAKEKSDDGFAPIEGYSDTFYDGVLWAFGKLVQIYPSDDENGIDNGPIVEAERAGGDCISREYVEGIVEELENICQNAPEEVLELLSKVKNAPTVESTRPQGKWDKRVIHTPNYNVKRFFCSECGKNEERFSKFCPNCGAEMRKGGTEE